jgi:predicted ATPase
VLGRPRPARSAVNGRLPVTAVVAAPTVPEDWDADGWPATIPCVRQLLDEGLELGPLTILVGENGSGKSTLVEAIAQAYGLSPEGGSTGARHSTRPSESPLWRAIRLQRGVGAARWGYFLRAEAMHGFFTYREANPSGPFRGEPRREPEQFHEMSHGESFLELLGGRAFLDPGFYVLDEPESALSFAGCLALVGLLHRIAADGRRQAIVATHSPVIAATPGARILEVGSDGWTERAWDELDLVLNWRDFLTDPAFFLRHVLE